jgi:hypothetical protein
MSEFNCIPIHAQCFNSLELASKLVHFFWFLHIVTTGKEITVEKSYSDAYTFGTFFLDDWECVVVFFLPKIQKRNNIKTIGNLIYTLIQIRQPRVSMLFKLLNIKIT